MDAHRRKLALYHVVIFDAEGEKAANATVTLTNPSNAQEVLYAARIVADCRSKRLGHGMRVEVWSLDGSTLHLGVVKR
jgi:hypothetical protein